MSMPKNPNTGQAPAIKNAMRAMKLTAPKKPISTRKPTRPSERCGVIIAEKIVGSRLSAVMGVSIPEIMAKKSVRKPPAKALAKSQAKARKSLALARKGKAAKAKPASKHAKA